MATRSSSLMAALLQRIRPLKAWSTSVLRNTRPFSSISSSIEADAAEAEFSPASEDDLRSRLFRLRFPKRSATAALERWVGEGREVKAPELRQIAKELRRSQRYKHALEISEWMKMHHESDLSESDYGFRIDLITKVFGPNSAEDFFEGLPPTAKSCEAHTALLHSYDGAKLTKKAEDLFERMKKGNFSSNLMAYNEMMALYMSVGQLDKVPMVVEELKRHKVSPDLFTYNLWISSCAATLDIDAVRKIIDETAHDPNSDKGWITYMKLVDIYVTTGHLVSSDNSIVESDTKISQREWITYDFLIILYSGLGNKERMNAIWKSMQMTYYLMLGHAKDAGEVIDQWR